MVNIKVLFDASVYTGRGTQSFHVTANSVEELVKQMLADGGTYVNAERSDWIPLHAILRVWEE